MCYLYHTCVVWGVFLACNTYQRYNIGDKVNYLVSMAPHGSEVQFDPDEEEWMAYVERLYYYLIANEVTSDTKKCAISYVRVWTNCLQNHLHSGRFRDSKKKTFKYVH